MTMSSSRLGKTRRDSRRRLSASSWRRGMKCCSVLGSSELPSFSLSKLCIRQVPRLHISISMSASATCGSTTAKGLYANSSFVLIHYAFGASERRHCLCLCSPLRPRGRAGVFRRREGPASLPFSRGSPSPCSCPFSTVRGFFSSRGLPPTDPGGIRPPFVLMYVVFVELTYVRGIHQPGRSDVFPERDCVPLHNQVGLVLCRPQVLHRHVRDRLGRFGLRGGQVRSDFSSAWKGSSEILQEF